MRLSYYGYRYYDELSLSWTQADPLFRFVPELAGANPRAATLYAFSLNNPVRYMDPDGLQAKSIASECEGCTGSETIYIYGRLDNIEGDGTTFLERSGSQTN